MNDSIYTDKENAAMFCNAIRELAAKPENLENLESYLSSHFSAWMKKFAFDPDTITSELVHFSRMDI